DRLEILRTALAVRNQRLDLSEPPIPVDLEAHRNDHRRARFTHRREGDDLTSGLIGDVQLIRAAAGDRVPEAVTEQQTLPVLGVFEIARDLELLRILGNQGVEILLGDALETRTI